MRIGKKSPLQVSVSVPQVNAMTGEWSMRSGTDIVYCGLQKVVFTSVGYDHIRVADFSVDYCSSFTCYPLAAVGVVGAEVPKHYQ